MITASTGTMSRGATQIRATVPSRSARSTFSIFIASMMASVSPARTFWPGSTAIETTKPRHRRPERLRRVRVLLLLHQRVEFGDPRRHHPRDDVDAAPRQPHAGRDRPHLDRDRLAADRAGPQGIAGLPVGDDGQLAIAPARNHLEHPERGFLRIVGDGRAG